MPLWEYQKRCEGKQSMAETMCLQNLTEHKLEHRQKYNQDGGWLEHQFRVTQGEKTKIMHIQEHTWRKLNHEPPNHEIQEIPEELAKIRTNSKLQTLMREHPHTQEWITRPYTHGEICKNAKTLKRNASAKPDGITGVSIKLYGQTQVPLSMNQISAGHTMPDTWEIGAITHS